MNVEKIPMRKQSRQMRSEEDVDALLREAPVGRLGTCYQGEAYVVPLNYVYFNGMVYFHSALEGKKIRNMVENPRVCFEVDEILEFTADASGKACEYGVNFRSVIVSGTARLVEDTPTKAQALEALMAKYAPGGRFNPFTAKDIASVAVWEIKIEEKAGKRKPNP